MASSYYGTKNNIKRNPSMQYAIIYANARPYSGYVNCVCVCEYLELK